MEMADVGSTYDGVVEGGPYNVDLCISKLDNEGICKKNVVIAGEKKILYFLLYR